LVASPIGNLGDVSRRALDVLARAELLACEDTRVTKKLLTAYDIHRPLLSYHDHNADRVRPKLIEALKLGKSVALISDAGTPLISDPGYKLVTAALAADVAVTTVPGPSAVLAALSLAGLPSEQFFFAGFLPAKATARRKALAELVAIPGALVFFESNRRLAASLADMAQVLGGDRPAAVARELTKLHEEVRRASLAELAESYGAAAAPKGEIVVVVAPPSPATREIDDTALDRRLAAALAQASLRDAVAQVTAETGLPRRRVYTRALELSKAEEA
jgi:16S rRNA (cytidine1402-2'-O)-methyltransferase